MSKDIIYISERPPEYSLDCPEPRRVAELQPVPIRPANLILEDLQGLLAELATFLQEATKYWPAGPVLPGVPQADRVRLLRCEPPSWDYRYAQSFYLQLSHEGEARKHRVFGLRAECSYAQYQGVEVYHPKLEHWPFFRDEEGHSTYSRPSFDWRYPQTGPLQLRDYQLKQLVDQLQYSYLRELKELTKNSWEQAVDAWVGLEKTKGEPFTHFEERSHAEQSAYEDRKYRRELLRRHQNRNT